MNGKVIFLVIGLLLILVLGPNISRIHYQARLGLFYEDPGTPYEDRYNLSEEKYGSFNVVKKDDGEFYTILKKNFSSWADSKGGPRYWVETNSHNLREEDISGRKGSNEVRILFLGDSFTYGWGVNVSDRYPDLVEKELNETSECNYRAIVSAVPGWGAKDSASYLSKRGKKYNPDIVVASLEYHDWISNKKWHKMHKNFKYKLEKQNSSLSGSERKKAMMAYYRNASSNFWESPGGSSFEQSIDNISKTTEKLNASLMVYNLFPRSDKRMIEFVEKKADKQGFQTVRPSPMLKLAPPGAINFSARDPHPNARGHYFLAQKLIRNKENQFLSECSIS